MDAEKNGKKVEPLEISEGNDYVDFDKVLTHVGQFGWWQKKIFFWCCVASALNGIATLAFAFVGFVPKYRCAVPYCENAYNGSYFGQDGEALADYVIQGSPNSSISESGSCYVFDYNKEAFPVEPEVTSNFWKTLLATLPVPSLIFDNTVVDSSIVTEYGLTCSNKFTKNILGAVYMVGLMLGSFAFGVISDRLGRVPALMIGFVMTSVSGVIGAFMPSEVGYGIMRFISGVGAKGLFMVAFVICIEFTGPAYLAFLGIAINIPFAIGEFFPGIFALYIREWVPLKLAFLLFTAHAALEKQALQIVNYAPIVVGCVMWFTIPESPRWLISMGKFEKAREIIQKGAKTNKKEVPNNVLYDEKPEVVEAAKETPGIIDTFRPAVILGRTLNMYYQWMAVTFCYYGLSYGATNLLGDVHTNFFLTIGIEIPGYIFAFLVMDCWGRRPILSFCQTVAGVGCILAGLLVDNKDLAVLQVCLSLLGKFGASASFSIVYQYTAEMFPTPIRTIAVGNCSLFARFGAIFALLVDGLADIWGPFPNVLMGSVAVLAGFLALALPETAGLTLPETMHEAVDIGKHKRGLCHCTCPNSCSEIIIRDEK